MKISNFLIIKHMFEKSSLNIFIIAILLSLTFSFFHSLLVYGGDIYTYTDKNGNVVISNTPIPEKHKSKAKKIDSYKDLTPSESAQQEREILEGNLNRLFKECLDGAEKSYISAVDAECKRRGQTNNCALSVTLMDSLRTDREIWKSECRKAAKR